jgi:aflatoxin B1 aldehyde reductase
MNNIVLGTMNIEYQYSSNKDKSIESYKDIIEKYILECNENNIYLDTAYYYGNTKTEKVLGEILDNNNKKIKIATKANPWFENDFTNGKLGQLSEINIKKQLTTSLLNLNKDKVDIFYLHCPDYETPIEETLEACTDLWRKEKFDNFGISNHSLVQLKNILEVCESKNYIIPKYYQGMYNLISRKVEEIFPLLNDYNIDFWAYNPLAGGLLTGKYKNKMVENSRFNNNKIYQNIFWKEPIINAFEDFFNFDNCCEYSLQWLTYYSKLRENDKIIIGVSTVNQLNININYMKEKKEYNITNTDIMYEKIKDISPNYYY